MYEGEELTPEVIAELMQTQEGRRLIEQMLGDDGTGGALSQIGASPDIPGATRGLPPAQIGASPDIPGATRGLPSGISGINNPEDENRLRMMQQLMRRPMY